MIHQYDSTCLDCGKSFNFDQVDYKDFAACPFCFSMNHEHLDVTNTIKNDEETKEEDKKE